MLRTVFLSSTFRDMHFERDVIHTKVMPKINAEAEKNGDSFSVCDLRWGIDTSEMKEKESTRKVLDVCLSEIDRSRPYMIVILGYRYGWMPGARRIRTMVDLPLEDEDISVTALEIEYGALSDPDTISHTLFYFRELDGDAEDVYGPEDALHAEKLEKLKQRIRNTPGAHFRTYHVATDDWKESMNAFSRMITEDLLGLLTEEWSLNAGLDAYTLDQRRHWEYLSEKDQQFVSRDSLVNSCLTDLCENGKDIVLFGEPGCGKSTLISHMGAVLKERGYRVFPMFCSYTSYCGTGLDILRYQIRMLEDLLLTEHFGDKDLERIPALSDWNSRFAELCRRYEIEGKDTVVFLIDGLDQLTADETASKFAFLPPVSGSKIRFLMSTVTGSPMPGSPIRKEVVPLTSAESREIIRGIMASWHRELPEPVADRILAREGAAYPLYLSLFVQRFLMMNYDDFQEIARKGDGIKAIIAYQLQLADSCPDDLDELTVSLLHHASERIGGESVMRAAELIAVSRRGLRFSDLSGLMKKAGYSWNALDMAAFVQYMGTMFLYRGDGRYDFSHNSIRTGILRRCKDPDILREHAADWLVSLPIKDEVRRQELLWTLMQADRKEQFGECLAEMVFNGECGNSAARDIAFSILNDGGTWIIDMIKECFLQNNFSNLFIFLSTDVMAVIPNTPDNLNIKMDVCNTLSLATQKRYAVDKTDGNLWEIAVSYERIVSILEAFETERYLEYALKLTEKILRIREVLMEHIRECGNPEKCRQYLSQEVFHGFRLSREPTQEECASILQSFAAEYERGITVAHMDTALLLMHLKRYDEALEHLKIVLDLRDRMRAQGKGKLLLKSENEILEIAAACRISAAVCIQKKDEDSMRMAGELAGRAVQLCEAAVEEVGTLQAKESLCLARMVQAFYLQEKGDPERSLSITLECIPVLESVYNETRSEDTRHALSNAYQQAGRLYRKRGEGDDLRRAEEMIRRGMAIGESASGGQQSIEDAHDQIGAELDLIRTRQQSSRKSPDGEIMGQLAKAYGDSVKLLAEVESEKAFQDLCAVMDAAEDALGKLALTESAREHISGELLLERIRQELSHCTPSQEDLRSIIVELGMNGEKLSSGESGTDAELEDGVKDILKLFGIDPCISKFHCGCLMLLNAVHLSRQLFSETKREEDLDFLAVSLMKAIAPAMRFDEEKAAEMNKELLSVASTLHQRTGKEKYAQMQFMAMYGMQVLGKSGNQKQEPGENAATELEEQIKALEKQLAELTGGANLIKRLKLSRRIDQLRRELKKRNKG